MFRNRQALAVLLAASGLRLLAAHEETPLPKDLPPYGAERPIPAPAVTQRTLPNGLDVWVLNRPGFPKVTACMVIRGGNAHDAADRQGLTGFMAGLLNEGTRTRSSRQIAEELQAIGGELGAYANLDATFVQGSCLTNGLPALVHLMADITRRPVFPDHEVELAKTNALQGLQAQEAQPAFQANRAFNAALFGNHPYRYASLTAETVKGIQPETLRALHAERFQPGRALLILGGDIQEAAAMKLVAAAFGDWKGGAGTLAPLPAAPQASAHEFLLLPRPGSVQATLRVGRPAVPATHADSIPLQLANVILGGSFDSRITKNIREDKGYTYSPGARASAQQVGGSYTVRADVRSDVTAASLMEILYEMDRMGTTQVGEAELGRAKRFMGGTYLFQNQMLAALTGTLAGYWVNGLTPMALAEFIPKVNAVTAGDVRRIGRTYFAAKDQTIVVVGDEAKVKAELEQFGPVRILKK
ncbi:M16 family metallopeptidase [Mesoterricola silvestris]|uniref:Peptidase M16 n=1 Tax=Mesoterricola silvestris TaxID=2927979 RepID=A0AA48H1K6_9BACT|nr:pitrilysin family protein [Mesoterricola silvestris]BDU74338.1 peptidase M16 [Mesoterricola silvestris]